MLKIFEDKELKSLNTFGIEARAKYFVSLNQPDEIQELIQFPEYKQSRSLILGGGSNMLFGGNFDGIVIRVGFKGIEIVESNEDFSYVKSMAGEEWDDLVAFCVEHGLSGVENLSLIPGKVGASPVQNIGAYGCEVKDVIHSLEAVNLEDGQLRIFKPEECGFGYRESVFKKELKGKYLIQSVTFKLNRRGEVKLNYGSLKEQLNKMGIESPTVKHIREAICAVRREKLPDPEVLGNAGSFFKNPVVSLDKYTQLKNQYPDIVAFNESPERMKLAAGWLIEKAGWKGFRKGDAGVHQKQALVLVNYGGASGLDIVNLANDIRKSIFKKFEVELEQEVNLIN